VTLADLTPMLPSAACQSKMAMSNRALPTLPVVMTAPPRARKKGRGDPSKLPRPQDSIGLPLKARADLYISGCQFFRTSR